MRNGFFKTGLLDGDGREQVMGFFMRGDLFGLDGIGTGRYECTATALEDSEIAVLPFARMEELARDDPVMQRQLHGVLSREIVRDHGVMLLLGSMSAQARLATFLMNLSMRYRRRGYSPSDFILRMTRAEIGSYLGLEIETVSRLFSAFHKEQVLDVQQRRVRILDTARLQALLD